MTPFPSDGAVHIKHLDGHFEHVPYFSLPANDLTEVIAPSCYSCFDYPNALADLVWSRLGYRVVTGVNVYVASMLAAHALSKFGACSYQGGVLRA